METIGPGSPNGDRFELVRHIARGGGGTVWVAHDRTLDRPVALKQVEIPGELSPGDREAAKERVLREAKAAARMAHPGVVTVYDVLDGGDVVQLVMELVESPTLRQVVDREGPLDEAAVAGLGLALLDVLEHAHLQGIVHRDVKPSNVFVHQDGRTQLADFGIVSIAGETTLTHTDTALGSPDYIAPEQAQGARAAPEADLWGLGATLYLAVEGVAPFARSGVIPTLQAVVNDERRAYHRADRLRSVIDQLLRKDPQDRPDPEQVRPDLEQIVAGHEPGRVTAPLAAPTSGTDTARADASALEGSAWPDPHAGRAPHADEPPAEGDVPSEPAPRPGADADDAGRGPSPARRPALLVASLVAVLAIAGMATMLGTGADEPDGEVAEEPAEGSGEAQAGGDDGSGEAPEGDDVDSGDTLAEADEAPDDWRTAEGETYRVAVPSPWQEQDAGGNRTDFVDPDSGAYLRVDHTDDPAPDPLADWEAAAADFAERHEDYEQVRLEPVSYRDYDAAVWEYSYTDGGVPLRAINLNVVDGDHAYALNLQSPRDEWDDVREHMPYVMAGFQPDR
jgi:eukaryotic-like serine/threonine-protein kinase